MRSKQYAPKKSKSLLLKDYQETSAALGEPYDKIRSCKFRIECYLIHVTKHLLNLLFITQNSAAFDSTYYWLVITHFFNSCYRNIAQIRLGFSTLAFRASAKLFCLLNSLQQLEYSLNISFTTGIKKKNH